MNKREMIHALIDKLLDIEEAGTKKELYFTYYGFDSHNSLDFHFCEGNGSRDYVLGRRSTVYFKGGTGNPDKDFDNALFDIKLIKNTPDAEPKVQVTLTQDKARELGLIA